MKRRFVTLDVFTDRRFAGNPLAVVLESEGLDTAAMQAIAREFNLSETVFVLPPEDAAHRARYRIFTPKRELPFAGHPTVGTAVLLGCLDGGRRARDMVLEENIGPVPCRVTPAGAGGQATLRLPALPAEAGAPPPSATWPRRSASPPATSGFGDFAPSLLVGRQSASPSCRCKSLDAVGRAKPDLRRFRQCARRAGARRRVCVLPGDGRSRATIFMPACSRRPMGVVEDPGDRLGGGGLRRRAGALRRPHGRRSQRGHRAGLRDGPAEPDPAWR